MVVNVAYSKDHFDKSVAEAGTSLVVVEFTAQWCNASASSLQKVNLLSALPNVYFIKVDAEKNREVSDQYKVNSLPTFIFLKNGEQVDRMDYSQPKELEDRVNKYRA